MSATSVEEERSIEISKEDFHKDPLSYFRQASEARQVVVRDAKGDLALVIGGALDVLVPG